MKQKLKSLLLIALVAMATTLGIRAEEEGFNGGKLEQIWKSSTILGVSTVIGEEWPDGGQQGYGADDKIYVHLNFQGKIVSHDSNDFLPDWEVETALDYEDGFIDAALSHDEAGNWIVRTKNQNYYLGSYENEFLLIKHDNSQRTYITLPESICPFAGTANCMMYLGTASGDIFSAEGGTLAFAGGRDGIYFITIRNGQLVESESFKADFVKVAGPENDQFVYSVEAHVNAWRASDGTVHYLYINRADDPIDMVLDKENRVFKGTCIDVHRQMPEGYSRGQMNGYSMFSMGGKDYMVFPSIPNWLDAFNIIEYNIEDGTFVHKAYHKNDYPKTSTDYPYEVSIACDWLNGEVINDSTAYIYQYFPWGYMAKYKFVDPIEDTPLEYIVNEGEVNNTYTIADDIIAVYIAEKEPTRLYAKDLGRHRYPSVKGEDEVDYVKDMAKLQESEWDQSNWVLLDFNTAEEAQKFLASSNSKGVIKGGTLTGVLTDKLNPTMKVTSYKEPTQWTDYQENYYVTGNMMDPLVQTDNKGKHIFFVEPKPQEYVKVFWATYDGPERKHFHAPDNQQGSNGHDLKGSFNVDWSLYPGNYLTDFIKGNTYNFHAIVRYTKPHHVAIEDGEEPSGAPRREGEEEVREGDYMVFPLEGGDEVATAINEVTSDCFPVEVTYVNMMGMTSTTPFEGLNIVVTRYSNGSSLVTKEMRYNH